MELKGTQTETNILTAFAGGSQARNRYTFYAEKAREEGFEQIALIFEETASQERAHAQRLYGFLEGGEVEVQAGFPAGVVGTTAENLRSAAAGERYEHSEMYPGFAEVAREEGLKQIAATFEAIAVAEKQHERRYVALAENVEGAKVFQKDAPVVWRCLYCGFVQEGNEAPKVCRACLKPQAHFELLGENW